MVETLDRGYRPVLWVGQSDLRADAKHAPVRFEVGAIGNSEAFDVSPQHRIHIAGWQAELNFGQPEVLVSAVHLVGLPGVSRRPPVRVTLCPCPHGASRDHPQRGHVVRKLFPRRQHRTPRGRDPSPDARAIRGAVRADAHRAPCPPARAGPRGPRSRRLDGDEGVPRIPLKIQDRRQVAMVDPVPRPPPAPTVSHGPPRRFRRVSIMPRSLAPSPMASTSSAVSPSRAEISSSACTFASRPRMGRATSPVRTPLSGQKRVGPVLVEAQLLRDDGGEGHEPARDQHRAGAMSLHRRHQRGTPRHRRDALRQDLGDGVLGQPLQQSDPFDQRSLEIQLAVHGAFRDGADGLRPRRPPRPVRRRIPAGSWCCPCRPAASSSSALRRAARPCPRLRPEDCPTPGRGFSAGAPPRIPPRWLGSSQTTSPPPIALRRFRDKRRVQNHRRVGDERDGMHPASEP